MRRGQAPRKTDTAASAAHSGAAEDALSHNLLGQRLGRKGRDTRERILAAAERLLADAGGPPLSLSAVAREASLAMTTLYLYFNDLTELGVAVLDRTTAPAEAAYVRMLRTRWPDDDLGEHCRQFVHGYATFWEQHQRLLHLRNALAGDERLRAHRTETTVEMIRLFIAQMDGDPSALSSDYAMATALMTGIERVVTLTTDAIFKSRSVKPDVQAQVLLHAEARLFELAIRDGRAARVSR